MSAGKRDAVTLYRVAAMNGPERRVGPWETTRSAVAHIGEEVQEETFVPSASVAGLVKAAEGVIPANFEPFKPGFKEVPGSRLKALVEALAQFKAEDN